MNPGAQIARPDFRPDCRRRRRSAARIPFPLNLSGSLRLHASVANPAKSNRRPRRLKIALNPFPLNKTSVSNRRKLALFLASVLPFFRLA